MRAILQKEFGGPETLYIGETNRPDVSAHQVLIEVYYAALNRADLLQREGKYPPPPGESNILGLEAAGVVAKVGEEVTTCKVGDSVMALLAGGGQAEFVVVDSMLVWTVPNAINLKNAAAIPEVFLTAYQALYFEGNGGNGKTVLIHAGASGVGTAAIQLAKARGCRVITTSSNGKVDICKELGADLTINYQNQDFTDEVKRVTKGQGVDTILDFIGAPYFKQNLDSLANDGLLMMISVMGGVKLDDLNLYPILKKRITIKGTTLRARSIDYKHNLINAFLNDFSSELESGRITPIIDCVFDWENIKDAHYYMQENKNKGKIVLQIKS
jgi:putative PIG3 family NAD(P)H quinone oxidoreductase